MPRLPVPVLSAALLIFLPLCKATAQTGATQLLEAQILLDRAGHSPGVIDGKAGGNTRRALGAFEQASGLPVDGKLDTEVMERLQAGSTEPLLVDHRIEEAEVNRLVDVPDGMEAQASLDHLGYETAAEALAEKFHMSQAFLNHLNPNATFAAGEIIKVVRPGKDELGSKVSRIEVDKGRSEVRAYDSGGQLLASYPGTIGSDSFPSPSGTMEVRAVAPAPTYYFDPSGREWGPDKRLTVAAGPNNPVGGTWIDLTKEGYGIHGSPDPRLIGKTASHGCVRLTNWDAAELGGAVENGATVAFL